jgi:hypothetical protein
MILANVPPIVVKSKKMLWLRLRDTFDISPLKSMEHAYKIITKELKLKIEIIV